MPQPDAKPLTRAQRLAVRVGPWLIKSLAATWRVTVINDQPWRTRIQQGKSFVFTLWHGQMLPLIWQHRDEGVAMLVSEHRDGELIARIAQRLGFRTIRGSSTRGAARALLALSRELQDGTVVAVTPDGPKGPLHSFSPGAVVAAQRANAPIVAVGFHASSVWQLRSWDRFTIPKPFARVVVAYSDPIEVSAETARASIEESSHFADIVHGVIAKAAATMAGTKP